MPLNRIVSIFMNKVTEHQLRIAFPTAPISLIDQYLPYINKTLNQYNIDSYHDTAMFLAQIGHESGDLKFVRENLNYSSEGLLKTFKKYFASKEIADQYARNPEKIANRVYANRMGNGPESSGDGWKYRGRGLIQITGKNNYTQLSKNLDLTLEEVVKYLETPEGACISAGDFWKSRNLYGKDITQATRLINGGLHGFDDRKNRYDRIIVTI